MVNVTVDQVRLLMDYPEQIRNMSVFAAVDHGKSTLSDSLVGVAGIKQRETLDQSFILGFLPDEISLGITTKPPAISMYYHVGKDLVENLKDDQRDFLINLI